MHQHTQTHPHLGRTIVWIAFALVVMVAVTGCGRAPLTATADSGLLAEVDRDREPQPAGLIETVIDTVKVVPAPVPVPRPGAGDVAAWTVVATVPVRKGVDQAVHGGRYTLNFAQGSLDSDAQITIKQYDPDVLDVQFGPHGTQFKTPVELSIDLAGTLADPGTVEEPTCEPVFYYLDETVHHWVVIPSVTDRANKRLIVRLEHFSRYAVGSKAGWRQQPCTDSDGAE